ncbi:MAG: magnesium transporter [Bacteroidales bacterium]|nr:magnesium transporter [Bacteroidales bacterium]
MHFELTRNFLDNLIEIIEKKDEKKAAEVMAEMRAVDIAEIYDSLNLDQAKYLFLLIEDREKAADVIAELDDNDRSRFLKVLPDEVIASKFIDHMDSDDAADVIADLPDERQGEVLQKIKNIDQAGNIADLMAYDEDTAGGLMAKEIITVHINDDVEKAISEIRKQVNEVDDIYYVYVVDDDYILRGTVSLTKLLLASKGSEIKDIFNKDVIYVKADMKDEDVANLSDKYDLVALPVVDELGRLLGRITFDDLVDVMREEAEKDYQMMSGISEDVEHSDKIWRLTRARLPWLLVGLIGEIIGSKVLAGYEIQLASHAALAFFLPLIAAMGGNAGVQSASIVVQGLANGSISMESTFKKVFKEFSVAFINGIICAVILFGYNFFFSDSFALTLTVSVALFSVIIFASLFGTFVPLALYKLKIDPAIATGPFITTSNDIFGLLIYMTIGGILFAII